MPEPSAPRSPRRRLLVVASRYPTPDRPEAGAFVARRVDALRARGVEVVVAAPTGYGYGPIRRYLQIARTALATRRRFDAVEGHFLFPAGLVALAAARLRRQPLVVYAHGADVNRVANRSPFHRFLARVVARGASAVVTNSADTAAAVSRLGAGSIVVSPGVDMTEFSPSQEPKSAIRARLGLPDGLLALYVGELAARKGADIFAAAIGAATGWQGVMVGSGELAGEIAQTAESETALTLRPPVPPGDVPDLFRAADVVVVPSRHEPLGLAAIEALACGTPIVASNVGGLAEIVADGVNGLAVPPGDIAAVTEALATLADPELRSRLAAAARGSVSAHDLAVTTDRMAEVWASVGVAGIGAGSRNRE